MAIGYAVWVFNWFPTQNTRVSPDEIRWGTRHQHVEFCHAHVFGCPVFVLEPKLQDGTKIPNFPSGAQLRMFLGFSSLHSSLVTMILNVRTSKISPEYHMVFNDKLF